MSNGEVTKTLPAVHVTTLLDKMVERTRQLAVAEGQTICFQGEDSNAIYFIVAGQVKITVVSSSGKEAVLAVLGPQEFFLEGRTVGRSSRVRVATAIAPSTLLRIEKQALLRAIQDRPELRERLMSALLLRNMAIEEDLCDQHFNQSEKRLARALLKLARSKDDEIPRDAHIPALRHETLAEMVGTTRPRISRFMAKFKRMGLIDYNRCMSNPRFVVRTALLTDRILHNPVNASGGWSSHN
jgi:CRP/FNR family cyclic AMP-dependent transcriptional regulator